MLAQARRTLLEQVLPGLQGEAQSGALMVARVLSVILARLATDTRSLAAADMGKPTDELAALAPLLGRDAAAARQAAGSSAAAVAELSRRLMSDIRAGAFDPPGARHDALLRSLFDLTRAKLAESNPKVLQQMDAARKEARDGR
jgi:hypothetical protein